MDKFIGCGVVVWGNEEYGTLNCGDPMGFWEKDKDGNNIWVIKDYYKCSSCKTSKEKQQ